MAALARALDLESVNSLNHEVKKAINNLKEKEARFLVDSYYAIQKYRKAIGNQIRSLGGDEDANAILGWLFENVSTIEKQIKRALDAYTDNFLLGRWCKSIPGIGPVLTAGLMAHVDINKAPHVSHIWSFAGLNPKREWRKGEKRPWNSSLKELCWKAGQCFIKVRNVQSDIYGGIYWERKLLEWKRNLAGELADQAKEKLEKFNIGKQTGAYLWYSGQLLPRPGVSTEMMRKSLNPIEYCDRVGVGQGIPMLPPAHITERAARFAVKIFLSHFHHVYYEITFGKPPAKPYVLTFLGHVDYIEPPNWPLDRQDKQQKV